MRLYSNVYNYAIYTLNYYEDKYFISFFEHFKHTVKICGQCTYTLIIIKKKKIDNKSFEMHFLKEQFWRALMFWNVFLEGEIYLEFMVAD